MFLEEERPQNGGGDYQKDTGSEPRTGSFTRVGVARTELLIYLDSTDEADYSTDCINQFCAGIEISGHELCRFGDTGLSVSLRHCRTCRRNGGQHHNQSFLFH